MQSQKSVLRSSSNHYQTSPNKRQLRRYRTGILLPQEKVRVAQNQKYAKSIPPRKADSKPFSLKYLNILSRSSSISSDKSSVKDNKSCQCDCCGMNNKKISNLKRKCITFKSKMFYTLQLRKKLRYRFRNAVLAVMWMMRRNIKKRLMRAKERTKKLSRLQTKVFDQSPINNLILLNKFSIDQVQDQTIETERTPVNQVSLKLFETRSKAKNSIQIYIQNKLNENDLMKSGKFTSSNLLPKLQKIGTNKLYCRDKIRMQSPKHYKSQSSPYLHLQCLTYRNESRHFFISPQKERKSGTGQFIDLGQRQQSKRY